jgi:hypothetical protein
MSKVPAKVLEAINKAKGQGICNYRENQDLNGDAYCVIAQLGVLHGVDPKSWSENSSVSGVHNSEIASEYLSEYPVQSLEILQGAWDDGIDSVCDIGFHYGETNAETMALFAETLDW